MTTWRVRAGVSAGFCLAVTLGALSACNTARARTCTAGSEGFSDGVQFELRVLLEVERPPETACRVRVEALTDDVALARAYKDLGDLTTLGPPPIDFTRESVILREDTDQTPTRWIAALGASATVGGQGCVDVPATKCLVQLYVVPAKLDRAELKACTPTECTGSVPIL